MHPHALPLARGFGLGVTATPSLGSFRVQRSISRHMIKRDVAAAGFPSASVGSNSTNGAPPTPTNPSASAPRRAISRIWASGNSAPRNSAPAGASPPAAAAAPPRGALAGEAGEGAGGEPRAKAAHGCGSAGAARWRSKGAGMSAPPRVGERTCGGWKSGRSRAWGQGQAEGIRGSRGGWDYGPEGGGVQVKCCAGCQARECMRSCVRQDTPARAGTQWKGRTERWGGRQYTAGGGEAGSADQNIPKGWPRCETGGPGHHMRLKNKTGNSLTTREATLGAASAPAPSVRPRRIPPASTAGASPPP